MRCNAMQCENDHLHGPWDQKLVVPVSRQSLCQIDTSREAETFDQKWTTTAKKAPVRQPL